MGAAAFAEACPEHRLIVAAQVPKVDVTSAVQYCAEATCMATAAHGPAGPCGARSVSATAVFDASRSSRVRWLKMFFPVRR